MIFWRGMNDRNNTTLLKPANQKYYEYARDIVVENDTFKAYSLP